MTDPPAPTVETGRAAFRTAVADAPAGVREDGRPHVGAQFHPESVLTENSERLVANLVAACGGDDG